MVFGVVSSAGHIMPPHIFEFGLKVNTKVFLDVLKSVVIPWCNQVTGSRPRVWQQDSAPAHKSKETQVWLHKECYDFVPFLSLANLLPRLEPARLLPLVIRREHHQHDLPQHQSQPDRRHPPSICILLHFESADNGPVVITLIGRDMSCTAVNLRSHSLNIVSLSDMIEGSYRSWDLYTTAQLVDGLQQKKKTVFIKRKWNHVVFSRATILSFHPVYVCIIYF